MRTKTALTLFLFPLILGLSGCDKLGINMGGGEKKTDPGLIKGFAVIDLDTIANRLGSDAKLQNALRQRQDQLNSELTNLRSNFARQIKQQEELLQKKTQEEGNRERTPEEQQQMASLVQTLNVQLAQAQNTGQATLSQDQMKLIQIFREEVRPHAIKVANEKGFSIILTKNDAMLFDYDKSFDITEEVIRRMATPVTP